MSASDRGQRADGLNLDALYSQARVPRHALLWQDQTDGLLDALASADIC